MTTPFPFQDQDVNTAITWGGRALLAHEQGTGKSFSALLFLNRVKDSLPAIVVCPMSVKWAWQREAKTHFKLHAEVLEGTKPPERMSNSKLFILNYDILI